MRYYPFSAFASLMVIGSMTAAYPAMAQDRESGMTGSPAVSPDQSSEEGSGAQLREIVVTAQKRSESLQKAPVAITAIDSSVLSERGISDISQMSGLVPSARMNIQNNVVQIFVRGIGSGIDLPFVAEAIAMQANGVYTPQQMRASGLFDLERIEVLPGPQGTLYGRSAIGGAVNVVTKRPEHSFGGEASAEAGNYGTAHFSAAVNLPLSADTSIRAAVDYNHHDAYNNNGTDTLNGLGGRLSLLSEPSDNLTIFLWGQAYRNRSRAPSGFYTPLVDNPRDNIPAADAATAFFYPPDGFPLDIASNRQNNYQVGGQVDLELGGTTLTYIPGYTHYKEEMFRSISGFPIHHKFSGEAFSNELRLSNSDSGKVNWLAGLYQFHSRDPYFYTFGVAQDGTGPNLAGNDLVSKVTTYAGFGQATYSLTDTVRLTAGGRYSWAKLSTDNAEVTHPANPAIGDFSKAVAVYSYENSWKRFDWKVGAEVDVARNSLLYANVQTGFNPGAFRPDYPRQGTNVDPQKMIGFTAGSKNRVLDNRLQANVEGFYYRYTDQIIQAFNAATGGFDVFNAPRTRMYGVQLDSVLAVTPETQLRLNAAYLNAKIVRFDNGSVNLSGKRLPFSPRWTISGGVDHSIPMNSGAEIRLSVNSAFNSGYFVTFDNNPGIHQGSFTKTDVNLTYVAPDRSFDIGLFARNLEGNDVIAAGAATGRPAPQAGAAYLDAPRTYGIRLRGNF